MKSVIVSFVVVVVSGVTIGSCVAFGNSLVISVHVVLVKYKGKLSCFFGMKEGTSAVIVQMLTPIFFHAVDSLCEGEGKCSLLHGAGSHSSASKEQQTHFQ